MDEVPQKNSIKGVKYISLYEESGYGIAAKRYLKGLINQDVPLTWTPMVKGRGWGLGYEPFTGRSIGDIQLDPYCNRPIDYDTVIVHTVPEYFPLWGAREPRKRIIGYTVWETDKLPRHWPELLNRVDLLMVPCRWNEEVFKQCGVEVSIMVVPHIIDDTVDKDIREEEDISPADFVFYTIGTWTNRKAIWNTLRCYWDTFSDKDPTLLVIKTSKQDFTRAFLGRFLRDVRGTVTKLSREYKSPARIKLIDEEISERRIVSLHQRGDCYVSLCRSEGWGLGAFDAAGFGNAVIITGYGGQLDYLREDLAFLAKYSETSVQDSPGKESYSSDQKWADPDIDHASTLMKTVFENTNMSRGKGETLQKYVLENFNESRVMRQLLYSLSGE